MLTIDGDQLQLDMTLEVEQNIGDNVRTAVDFTKLKLLNSYPQPSKVRNRHEAFGIVAENHAKVSGCMKRVKNGYGHAAGDFGRYQPPCIGGSKLHLQ